MVNVVTYLDAAVGGEFSEEILRKLKRLRSARSFAPQFRIPNVGKEERGADRRSASNMFLRDQVTVTSVIFHYDVISAMRALLRLALREATTTSFSHPSRARKSQVARPGFKITRRNVPPHVPTSQPVLQPHCDELKILASVLYAIKLHSHHGPRKLSAVLMLRFAANTALKYHAYVYIA